MLTILSLLLVIVAAVVQSIPAPGHGGICTNASHCKDDECCCVSMMQPIGRRRGLSQLGTCKMLGIPGSPCDPTSPSGQPQSMVLECPCDTGLACYPQGWSGASAVPALHEPGRCAIGEF